MGNGSGVASRPQPHARAAMLWLGIDPSRNVTDAFWGREESWVGYLCARDGKALMQAMAARDIATVTTLLAQGAKGGRP